MEHETPRKDGRFWKFGGEKKENREVTEARELANELLSARVWDKFKHKRVTEKLGKDGHAAGEMRRRLALTKLSDSELHEKIGKVREETAAVAVGGFGSGVGSIVTGPGAAVLGPLAIIALFRGKHLLVEDQEIVDEYHRRHAAEVNATQEAE